MDLVQDDQGLARHGATPVHRGRHADLGVRHHRAVKVVRGVHVGVAERRVQLDADRGGRERPLLLQVLGGRDHGDRFDRAVRQQLGGDAQGERRLACAGGGHREKVVRAAPKIFDESLALPRA